ncbi:hypothetical protein STEG23_015445 [Scotinomys teguina]
MPLDQKVGDPYPTQRARLLGLRIDKPHPALQKPPESNRTLLTRSVTQFRNPGELLLPPPLTYLHVRVGEQPKKHPDTFRPRRPRSTQTALDQKDPRAPSATGPRDLPLPPYSVLVHLCCSPKLLDSPFFQVIVKIRDNREHSPANTEDLSPRVSPKREFPIEQSCEDEGHGTFSQWLQLYLWKRPQSLAKEPNSTEKETGCLASLPQPPAPGLHVPSPADPLLSFHLDLGPSMLDAVLGVMDAERAEKTKPVGDAHPGMQHPKARCRSNADLPLDDVIGL